MQAQVNIQIHFKNNVGNPVLITGSEDCVVKEVFSKVGDAKTRMTYTEANQEIVERIEDERWHYIEQNPIDGRTYENSLFDLPFNLA